MSALFLAGWLFLAAGTTHGADLDYLDPATRALPIACKAGDLERQAGKSMADVFGADWPAPSADGESLSHQAPVSTRLGRLAWPRGLEGQRALVVVAVLIGADGKALRAEALCSTMMGFDNAARHAAMHGEYEPAMVGGKPVTSPMTIAITFTAARNSRSLVNPAPSPRIP